ncbi:WD40-repeat-containing domain protein [Pisolithus croceorrhizus]|nr:WD40-repeat-containing domain protein [Pisolithus croceorrhizus]
MEYRVLHALDGHRAPINCAAFSEDGSCLGTGGDDGYILLWSVSGGTLDQCIKTTQGPITTLRWLHNNENDGHLFLASTGADGTLHVRSIFNNLCASKILCVHTLLDGPVEDLAVNNDHTFMAATGLGRVIVLSISLCTVADPVPDQPSRRALARSCHFFNNGKSLMVCFLDSKEYSMECFTVDPDLALQAGDKNRQYCIPRHNAIASQQLLHVRKLHIKTRDLRICAVQFDATGSAAIVGGDNGEVSIWNIESAKPMQVLSHGKEQLLVQTIAYHASQVSKNMIASCTTDAVDSSPMVKVWSTAVSPELDIFIVKHVASNVESADMSVKAPFVVFTQSVFWTLLVAVVGMVAGFVLSTVIHICDKAIYLY